jgi:hypothetical protein
VLPSLVAGTHDDAVGVLIFPYADVPVHEAEWPDAKFPLCRVQTTADISRTRTTYTLAGKPDLEGPHSCYAQPNGARTLGLGDGIEIDLTQTFGHQAKMTEISRCR